MSNQDKISGVLQTNAGWMYAEIRDDRVSILKFTGKPQNESSIQESPVSILLKTELDNYFSGKLKRFSLQLDPSGTSFQQKVWNLVSAIPYGQTTTYTALSETIGNPMAIRAVANAIAKNPLLVLIPCHRVIGSDGTLTGYAGGLDRKHMLLKLEGHTLPGKQLSVFDSIWETNNH